MPEVQLVSGGLEYTGWTKVSIRKSLEQVADEFTLTLTNQRVSDSGTSSPTGTTRAQVRTTADQLDESDECSIEIDGQRVVTGFLEDPTFDYDAKRADLTIKGRSLAGDIIDSSATFKTGGWSQATVLQIASDLLLPFGIGVLDPQNLAGEPFKNFRLEPGEKVFEAIARAANTRALLLMSTPTGDVQLAKASTTPSGRKLVLGENILSGTRTKTIRERFSTYYFRGQTAASDEDSGKAASQLFAQIDDPEVGRYRPLHVIGRKQKNRVDLAKRAAWERNVRAGQSIRYRYTVEEWTQDGVLWAPNMLVHVTDPWMNVEDDLLISAVEFTLDVDRTATLDLVSPTAFSPEPTAKLPKMYKGR